MKIAELEDLDALMDMAKKFAKASGYVDYTDDETIKEVIQKMLEAPRNESIIIMDDYGFIAGSCAVFPFGKGKIASETAWWIDENSRGENRGGKLMEAFEYWAKNVAEANMVVMSSIEALDKYVSKIYKKNGYKLYERAYMKVI